MAEAAQRFPIATPDTKEAYWIREIFEKHFPTAAAAGTVRKWVPKKEWGCPSDPSGRAQAVHNDYKEGEF